MAGRTQTRIVLDLDALPLLAGALECVQAGIASTMQEKNAQALKNADCTQALRDHAAFALLFDPQTAGGLLAAIPAARADACLGALLAADYPDSAIIGRVESCGGAGRVQLDLAVSR
jgi:selenide,water dikinase